MKRGIRKQDHENLSDSKIQEIIDLGKSITKKEACELLNISYNTTRLAKIIDDYEERKAYTIKRKKELKNQPISNEEIIYFISSYLESGNLTEIAQETHRSTQVIKRILNKYNIPLRKASSNYFNPPIIEKTSKEYNKNDLVYSSRYDQAALISNKIKEDIVHGNIYKIWLSKDQQYAMQPYYELADLREVQNLGVKIETRKWLGDLQLVVNQTLIDAKKSKKKDE